jgi:hypothetical protein
LKRGFRLLFAKTQAPLALNSRHLPDRIRRHRRCGEKNGGGNAVLWKTNEKLAPDIGSTLKRSDCHNTYFTLDESNRIASLTCRNAAASI